MATEPVVKKIGIPPLSLTIHHICLSHTQISEHMTSDHVNGIGTEEPMHTSASVTHPEHFQTLNGALDAGLPQKVAKKLGEVYHAGLVAHSDLDERASGALKEFNEEDALAMLQQFKASEQKCLLCKHLENI
uniref:Heterogeneous nuclear ribonucleoprotein Q acidic domain-containing protein n=1 Tax=Naja naja TaxID=35670 RepID=A0A8C7DUI5_NAJNA